MKNKTIALIYFGVLFLLVGFVFFMDYIVQEDITMPIFNPKAVEKPYVSYEDGGQRPYGIDSVEMVKMINVFGERDKRGGY